MMAVAVTLESVCTPSDNVVAREIEGEIVIVPLVAGIGDADDELYTLNETGRAVWQKLDGERTLAIVITQLSQDFEAPLAELEADVIGFAAEMVRRGILAARA
jgi:hypothetical protein